MSRNGSKEIGVETLTHKDAKRTNIPTAELQSVMDDAQKAPIRVAYERRNRDLDPQLVWRGKDEQDWSDLVVSAPPLYIQEKVHPKVLIEDLKRQTKARAKEAVGTALDLFSDFNGYPDKEAATEFYQHDINWNNRMILGDSLSVMASLAEREGLRGKVQCVFFDPPYGIKFNSNFQWSTTSRDVKDGNKDHVTREPEQVRAFRDTWKDGIHSYLTYLRDRLTVARDLLSESGSIFVQIGDENVHRLRALMDEVFGEANFCGQIGYKKTTGAGSPAIGTDVIASVKDYILWFAKNKDQVKYRQLYFEKEAGGVGAASYNRIQSADGAVVRPLKADEDYERDFKGKGWHLFASDNLTSQTGVESTQVAVDFQGKSFRPAKGGWKTNAVGLKRLKYASRLAIGGTALRYVRRLSDFSVAPINNDWGDTSTGSFTEEKIYVVQSGVKAVQRCILMATDPGDLVLDPTCGSGTTAYVAEQWGRRWITIDTSRVSLALARARIMGARYPYYLLADSREGQIKEGEVTRTPPKDTPTYGNIRQGFVYERVPHITLKSIANNTEIDVIWDKAQAEMEPLRAQLNKSVGKAWEEWEIPREADPKWSDEARKLHALWWEARLQRQKEIDASIAAKADSEYLYDKPYVDTGKVRVAGPFTVESLSPHRVLAFDHDDELIDILEASEGKRAAPERDEEDFAQMILENLRAAGVQQSHKEDRITFTAVTGWPGEFICAEGTYMDGEKQRRAGIFIGPEFGTVSRPDLVAAAREAGEAGFDVLISCAFNFDAHSAEFDKLGRVPVLKARMNTDLHMGADLKSTGVGNLFTIFGEPDIQIIPCDGNQVQVKIRGVDFFKAGNIQSDGTDTIALWMLDTDYNEESFFVRHAYFLGANDPYKALRTTLKSEIDAEAWESLNSDTSRPFDKPKSGRIAVKVINHLGDEVMKVFSVA